MLLWEASSRSKTSVTPALEPDDGARFRHHQPIGGDGSLQHLDLDRIVGNHVAGADVHQRVAQLHLVFRRGDDHAFVQPKCLGFAVVESFGRGQLHVAAVLHEDRRLDVLEFEHIRIGQILGGGARRHRVGAFVIGVAGEPRLPHDDLGARDHHPVGRDRQPRQRAHRIEPAVGAERRHAKHDHERKPDAGDPHQPAVAHRSTKRAPVVAARWRQEAARAGAFDLRSNGQTVHPRPVALQESGAFGGHFTVVQGIVAQKCGPPAALREPSGALNYGKKCPRRPSPPGPAGPGPAGTGSRRRPARVRPSRASMASSLSFRACRCSTSEAA